MVYQFDAPDESKAKPAASSPASTKLAGATHFSVNDNGKQSACYQTHPHSKAIHQQNLNTLRRADGNPAAADKDIENGVIHD